MANETEKSLEPKEPSYLHTSLDGHRLTLVFNHVHLTPKRTNLSQNRMGLLLGQLFCSPKLGSFV